MPKSRSRDSGRLQDLDLRNEYLLDSQITHNLCCNKRFVYDIKVSRKTLNMSGNGGVLRVTRKAKGQDSRSLSSNYGTSQDVV